MIPDLSQADLQWDNLMSANFSDTNFTKAILSEADLANTDLIKADLTNADLANAILRDADLTEADLTVADLTNANLTNADLSEATLADTNLTDSILSDTILYLTIFGNTDLSSVKNLDTVEHNARSTIGTDTLALTLRGSGGKFTDEQIVFFEGAGVPSTLLEYMPSILESNPIQFYSCFISYSTGDEEFADKLNEDLKGKGITTWKWNLDAVPGRYMRDNIDMAIRNYDKLILVCSANSLASAVADEAA